VFIFATCLPIKYIYESTSLPWFSHYIRCCHHPGTPVEAIKQKAKLTLAKNNGPGPQKELQNGSNYFPRPPRQDEEEEKEEEEDIRDQGDQMSL
jgi:hypothetical protein